MKKIYLLLITVMVASMLLIACTPVTEEPQPSVPVTNEQPGASSTIVAPTDSESEEDIIDDPAVETMSDRAEKHGIVYKDFNADGVLKVGHICKFTGGAFFENFTKTFGDILGTEGIEYILIDANNEENLFIGGVQNAIQQECDLVVITPPTTALAISAAEMCDAEGIPILSVVDACFDQYGDALPHIGLNDYGMCFAYGQGLAERAAEEGFFDNYDDLRIVGLGAPKVEALKIRVDAAIDGLRSGHNGIPDSCFILVDTKDGLFDNQMAALQGAYQSNPDVNHWIVLGCDENSYYATAQIFEENEHDFDNLLLGCIGGTPTFWEYMNRGGKYAEIVTVATHGPWAVGKQAAATVGEILRNGGTEIPQFSGIPFSIVRSDNWTIPFKEPIQEYIERGEFELNPEFDAQKTEWNK